MPPKLHFNPLPKRNLKFDPLSKRRSPKLVINDREIEDEPYEIYKSFNKSNNTPFTVKFSGRIVGKFTTLDDAHHFAKEYEP